VGTTGRWWLIPWYPAAFPIAFILFMWSGTGIEPIWIVRPMLIAVGFTLVLTLLLALLLRDRDAARWPPRPSSWRSRSATSWLRWRSR
jgi:hypothetical protein